MAFCSRCGASVAPGGTFCASCGAAVGATGIGDAGSPSALSANVAALLTYILGFVTGAVFLALEPYRNDRFVRFHAFQSIFFSIAVTIFWIIWTNIFWLTFAAVGFLWMIMSLFSSLLWLGLFLFWLFLMYKAYNNERYMIPIIGELAAKQAS